MISKLELGGKRVLVRFRRTTKDENITTNDSEARARSKIIPRWFSANYKRKKLNSKQLQTISKLELGGKWVLVRFRGTTKDKKPTTNDFEARAQKKMDPRLFSMNYKRYKHNYIRFCNWISE